MDGKGNVIKLVAAVLAILVAVGFTFHRSRAAMPGAVANNGQMDEMQMPSSDEMHKNMKMAALAADLSTTQVEKLDQLVDEGIKEIEKMRAEADANTTGPGWGGGGPGGGPGGGFPGMPGGGFRGGMGGIGRVMMEGQQMMTQDQQQKFRQAMQSQGGRAKREAKTKAALGEADYARYQEKRQQLRGGRGGGGRGGRGGQTTGQTGQQPSSTPTPGR